MIQFKKASSFIILLLFSFFIFTFWNNTSATLFELIPQEQTGIGFVNAMEERPGSNILETEFFYNGGGVAAGDINNDGLSDLYFTANTGTNALYLNRGNFSFENITNKAGVADSENWSTGTTMVDINADGLLDIYICKAGDIDSSLRHNKLFVNNGDLTFTEKAADYGLDDPGYCTQSAFFDYDRDGDLDVYLVNYSVKKLSGFNITTIREQFDSFAGDRLYRNDDGRFTDISREAGLLQNPIGFGLSATVSDLNNDGWPDIFVTNDYIERDYMYINQGDGTFRDEILTRTNLTSYYSMGSDIADINNDGWTDLLVADMLPYNPTRQRVFKTPDYSMYDQLALHGYHRQNMRNTLQLNNGDGTFSEIGQLAGISKTDWSWSTLLADFDNDGHKDLFVTNGFPRFYTDLDYLNQVLWKEHPNEQLPDDPSHLYELVKQMQQVELHNFAFKNRGDLYFEEVSASWGIGQKAVSNGAAYADLNNDGALDLIVNNINERPFVFKNTVAQRDSNHFLKIRLQGTGDNKFGVGARVILTTKNGTKYVQESFPTRGFQSSVDPVLLFGLGNNKEVDVEVIWPDQSQESIKNVRSNRTITLHQYKARLNETKQDEKKEQLPLALLNNQALGLDFHHQGSFIGDKINAPLMPHTLTNLGPALTHGDVNKDGLADVFIGGGADQAAALYLQQSDGRFRRAQVSAFEKHKAYEDVDALFFDADGNGAPDLYVVSGGNTDLSGGRLYQDRLYFNDGFGNFIHIPDALPRMESSGSVVTALDLEEDGDVDLFVGGRVQTNRYPESPRSYLLENSNGQFIDVTSQFSSELLNPGMVSDAEWADIDSDDRPELIIAGEWMPIRIFKQRDDRMFTEITEQVGLEETSGWWNELEVADLDRDGDMDLIGGNRGLNGPLNASPDKPLRIYAGDVNDDGFVDPIMAQIIKDEYYPVSTRDELLRQLPELEEKFPDYDSYSTATIEDVLTEEQIHKTRQLEVHTFASTIFKNDGNGSFHAEILPREAQIAPIFAIAIADVNKDTIPDILAIGNNFGIRPQVGPAAGEGVLLLGDGALGFTPQQLTASGFRASGDIRNITIFPGRIGTLILLARNNEPLIPYLYRGYQ